jgi:tripartite ATP-independent transporter DctM subunit
MDWISNSLALIMFAAMFIVVFCGYPVAFVLGGMALFFAILGSLLDVFSLAGFSNVILRIWGGVAVDQILVSVPMFILMGTLLERSGVARAMLVAVERLLGRAPGGLAIGVMLMGTILAASIGVVGASVVLLSMMALPQMLDQGYDKRLAIGSIGAAGTLGILIPPSIMLVVMGEMLSTSAGALFAAATLPGLMLSGLYMTYIVVTAAIAPAKAPPLERSPETSRSFAMDMIRGIVPMVALMTIVLGSMFAGWATATESAGVGVFGAMGIAALNGRLNRSTVFEAAFNAAKANGMVFMIFVGATAFSYVFRVLGGDDLMIVALAALGIDTKWEILGFLMVLIFLLGFPFEWLEICLIVLPVFLPILLKLDFSDHLGRASYFLPWFATLVAVNLQTAFLSPPFGATLFYMKGIAPPEVSMGDVYSAMTPFVILQLVGLGLCMAFPEIALWLPRETGLLD